MAAQDQMPTMDKNNLYREEVYTDLKVGTIRVLHPVQSDGSPDPSRPTRFVGSAQLLTPEGTVPISFEIEAANLQEAVERYAEAAKKGVEEFARQVAELRRELATSIVAARPEDLQKLGGKPPTGGSGAPGGAGGGGIILP
ncbi:MAG: hypothetical protein D6771_09240 [Zetaproteobacteria bacterium]|nr:MAG: hypothetical protein D6771_09240 [Zetaproteobacteria bacterium]